MGESGDKNNLFNGKQLLDSLDPECNQLKHAYDACFNAWFTEKFLKGGHQGPSPCDELLSTYSECVKNALKKKKIEVQPLEVDKSNLTSAQNNPQGKEKS